MRGGYTHGELTGLIIVSDVGDVHGVLGMGDVDPSRGAQDTVDEAGEGAGLLAKHGALGVSSIIGEAFGEGEGTGTTVSGRRGRVGGAVAGGEAVGRSQLDRR